ncbi:helix-turn-helix domain-containing protein [Chitinophaga eiseniae]|uniref:Helix-turn-helix transcriptional regulator n=1 Tax=Chitinophaga eiseniae TaxID=634771 RepID=A0A847SQE5_9BACT|nr:helix-turn-helix domain-containing protein [Chitinophaga eiseniae]NLR78292.1 helix-turn-helix transcriptional regulator [Chitinophaga eiseniae]
MKGLFHTIILLGAIQGFIVSGILFFTDKRRTANRLLSAFIFLMAMASFALYAWETNWFGSRWLVFIANFLPLITGMGFGPLLYFYVKAFTDPAFKMGRMERLQFLPMLIDVVPSLTSVIFVTGVLTGALRNKPGPWGIFIDTYNVYADIPRWASLAFYTLLSFRWLAANKPVTGTGWLRQLLWAMAIFEGIWLLYLVPYVIPRYTDLVLEKLDWYPVYIPLTILIYWLGIKGYIISHQQQIATPKNDTPLPAATIDTALVQLTKAMEDDRLYLNTELTLQVMSQHTGIPPKTISAVLNQHLHKNFNEYVNGYRVALFKEKVLQEDAAQLTFAGIAYDCGFASPATFQRVFKQLTGMSPSEFRKKSLEIS